MAGQRFKLAQFLVLLSLSLPLYITSYPHGFTISNEINCSYPELSSSMQELSRNFSYISRLEVIGKTIEGRDIMVMIISDQPNFRPLLRPQVKFVGNVMGNSGPACYVLLRLIRHLLTSYADEKSLERKLIQTNEIHILPNMNPDGFNKAVPGRCIGAEGKYNAFGKVLNRDFPHIFDPAEDSIRQLETQAVMSWINGNNFLSSISYFTGAKVVTYPFDSVPADELDSRRNMPHLTPDDDIFQHLASSYVANTNENINWHCPRTEKTFIDGKINGAEWSAIPGTMMDYNYVEGTFELFIGLSCCRMENNKDELEKIWMNNKLAMLRIIQESDYALRGQVVDSETNEPIRFAKLSKSYQNFRLNEKVQPMPWYTSVQGEFWRIVLPGSYLLEVSAKGYKSKSVPFEIQPFHTPQLMIKLDPEKSRLLSKRFDPKPTSLIETTTDAEIKSFSTQKNDLNAPPSEDMHSFLADHPGPSYDEYEEQTNINDLIITTVHNNGTSQNNGSVKVISNIFKSYFVNIKFFIVIFLWAN